MKLFHGVEESVKTVSKAKTTKATRPRVVPKRGKAVPNEVCFAFSSFLNIRKHIIIYPSIPYLLRHIIQSLFNCGREGNCKFTLDSELIGGHK